MSDETNSPEFERDEAIVTKIERLDLTSDPSIFLIKERRPYVNYLYVEKFTNSPLVEKHQTAHARPMTKIILHHSQIK